MFAVAAVPASPMPSLPITARTVAVFGAGAAVTNFVVSFFVAIHTSRWTLPTIPHSWIGPLTRCQT